MRRRRSILVLSLPGLLSVGYFGGGLGACLSGEVVDLGADLDARAPDATRVPESGPEREASLADRADSSPEDAMDAMDEPALPPGTLCLEDPSFEKHLPGDAQVNQPVQNMPPGWVVCPGGVTANSSSCGLPPTDQDEYVGLSVGLVAPFVYGPGSISTQLCASLEVGTTYALTVDYGLDTPVPDAQSNGEPPALQIWGGTKQCEMKEQLWRSASLPDACLWRTTCRTFVPSAAYRYLTLFPEIGSPSSLIYAQAYVIVDNLRPSPTCPSPLDASSTLDGASPDDGGQTQ
jgi:hypothetical protein